MSATIADATDMAMSDRATWQSGQLREALEVVAAALAVVGLVYALYGSGGRDRGVTSVAIALAAPWPIITKAWELPRRELWLAASVCAAAALLPILTPLGISAARDMNAYLYAPVLYLGARGFARDHQRRRLIGVLVLGVALLEYTRVWPVWIGENDRNYDLIGTFYWHNQFGAFSAAMAAFALAYTTRTRSLERVFAMIVAASSISMCVLSHSRGSELCLAIVGAVLLMLLIRRRAWSALGAVALCVAGAAAMTVALLASVATPTGSTGTIAAMTSNSLSSTSGYRLQFWSAALHVFAHSPLTSHGYGSFAALSGRYMPGGVGVTRWAHSAPLEALADGGLLLGVPVIVALVAFGYRAAMTVRRAGGSTGIAEPLFLAAGAAATVLIIHTCMDFDSQYPVLVALLALFAASAAPIPERTGQSGLRFTLPALCATAVATAVGVLMVAAYWHAGDAIDHASKSAATNDQAAAVRAATRQLGGIVADPRPAVWLVQAADSGVAVPSDALRRALRESREYRQLDAVYAAVWARENTKVQSDASR